MTTLEIILSVIIIVLLYAAYRFYSDRRLVEYMLAQTVFKADLLFERINTELADIIVGEHDETATAKGCISWKGTPYFLLPKDLTAIKVSVADAARVNELRDRESYQHNVADQFTEAVLQLSRNLSKKGVRVSLEPTEHFIHFMNARDR